MAGSCGLGEGLPPRLSHRRWKTHRAPALSVDRHTPERSRPWETSASGTRSCSTPRDCLPPHSVFCLAVPLFQVVVADRPVNALLIPGMKLKVVGNETRAIAAPRPCASTNQ